MGSSATSLARHRRSGWRNRRSRVGMWSFLSLSSSRRLNNSPSRTHSCGAEGKLPARPWNCTYGAKSPLFWLQKDGNNMFEGYYSPPLYLDLYNFGNGAQNDIFEKGFVTTPLPHSSTDRFTASPVRDILAATFIHTTPSFSPTSAPDSVNTPPVHKPSSSQNHSSSSLRKLKHTFGGSCRARHK